MKGHCLCGAVTIDDVPAQQSVGACHCGMCRSWVGGPFFAFTSKTEGVAISGPVKTYTSSDWAERAFCSDCGSALWYRLTLEGPMSEEYHFSAGLFDEAAKMNFDHEVYIDKKPTNYTFLNGEHRGQLTEGDILEMVASFASEDVK